MREAAVSWATAGLGTIASDAAVGRSLAVMASSSAEAVRAALDSWATRSHRIWRTLPRLSPRTAETGRT